MAKVNFWFLVLLSLVSCRRGPGTTDLSYTLAEGKTMGTYFRVTYADGQNRNLQANIETLLAEINQEVSTYIESATISQFNRSEQGIELGGKTHFLTNFKAAKEIFQNSGGSFDPTVMPLVNYWGFGYAPKKEVTAVDSMIIDSLMQYVGFDKVTLRGDRLVKNAPGVQLDFSALAKGYGVDAVGLMLESLGISNYLVDIGGEARGRGVNAKGTPWNIGINVPLEDAPLDEVQTVIPLDNRSVATSGNYRNFYEVDGVKYSHTINPQTGFPERNPLLSASVFADDCMIADAYATAFMVMGLEPAYELAARLPGIEAYFIFSLPDGAMMVKYTEGLQGLFANH